MRVFEAKLVYSLVSLGEEVTLDTPERVAAYLESAYAKNPMQEAFFTVLLDRKNHPLGRHMVTLGTLTSSLVHCRETFRAAIVEGAASIVVSHNHPSGDPRPSSADLSVTRSLREASQILGIDLLDHVMSAKRPPTPPAKATTHSGRLASSDLGGRSPPFCVQPPQDLMLAPARILQRHPSFITVQADPCQPMKMGLPALDFQKPINV